jgi:hypothetical protein
MNDPTSNIVMEQSLQAAKDAGACCPEAVAEILAPNLHIEQTMAGPVVFCNTENGVVPLATAIAKLRQNPTIKGLFERGAGLDLHHLTTPHFRAIRRYNPELFGLA